MTQEQLELEELSADYGWFHVMKGRLAKGLIREIGPTAWAVYCVIKAHANHADGRASPSQERIGELIGRGVDTVAEAVKALIDQGLISQARRGRHLEYRIVETAPLTDKRSGVPAGSADFPYVPAQFKGQLDAIKAFLADGIPPGKGVTITLNVNLIQQRDNGTVNVQQISLDKDTTAADLAKIKKLKVLDL